MSAMPPKMTPINVFARWRPLSQSEAGLGELERKSLSDPGPRFSISINHEASIENRPWTSPAAFHTIFDPEDDNYKVYTAVVAPMIPKFLGGENCSFFAYGHSGSGKTHTTLGYSFQDGCELGLCLHAARQIFDALHSLNEENMGQELGIGYSLFELRKKSAFDLLNYRTQCHIREGPDGKVNVRGETEILEGGRVRVRPIVQRQCWNFETFQQGLVQAFEQRATGSSTIHDQSSRTHAVLELEVVNQSLVDARAALFDRQSELVPVGKRSIDIKIEEEMKSVIRTPEGGWASNPDYQKNQERIDAAESEQAQFEARVAAAEKEIGDILQSSTSPCLGAKMLFVDLAGAEYEKGNGIQLQGSRQTPQERQEGRQINSDLLALKEVMRSWSQGQKRIPFRSSTLTMVLREHFINTGKGNSSIIVTISPATEQYAATLNTVKYGLQVKFTVREKTRRPIIAHLQYRTTTPYLARVKLFSPEGLPLVMLHGGVNPSDMFGAPLEQMAQAHRVIAIHLRGHGFSARSYANTPLDEPWSYEQMADDVAGLLSKLGIEKADFMGWSLGGGVALQAAIRYPKLVEKLIVISKSMRHDGNFPEIQAQFEVMPEKAAEYARNIEQSPLGKRYPDVDWELLFRQIGLMNCGSYDWAADVAGIAVPTLLIFADADMFSLDHMVEFYRILGGGTRDAGIDGSLRPTQNQLAIIPGTTHYNLMLTAARAVTDYAKKFLAR